MFLGSLAARLDPVTPDGPRMTFALVHADRSSAALVFPTRPSRVGLILMSPLYPGADRARPGAARVAMQAMGEAGERGAAQGIDALRPLLEPLPAPIRSVAMNMMLGFDPASVAATTRFLASNAQPLESARDLALLAVPVMIVPGTDPQHPAEIADRYASHLRRPVVVDAATPDLVEQIGRFCDGLDW